MTERTEQMILPIAHEPDPIVITVSRDAVGIESIINQLENIRLESIADERPNK